MNWRRMDDATITTPAYSRRSLKWIARAIVSSSVLVGLSTFAQYAQQADGPAASQPADESPSFLGKEGSQGVYVRDSTVAVEKFALAGRMERLKEWNKAADALQELVEKYTDRVVPSKKYGDNVIYQYTSVTRAVHEELAKWPAEGLGAYRARFEPIASDILKANPADLSTLNRVFTRYFPTDTAKHAAMTLIDRHLEAAEFPAAAWLGDRLLTLHPMLGDDRPMVMYCTALAHHLSGDDAAAMPLLDTLNAKFPDALGMIRGEETKLADSLSEELKQQPPVARASGNDSWPMIGGSPSRSRITSAVGQMGAKIFDVPYAPAQRNPQAPETDRRRTAQPDDATVRERGQMLGVMPAVDRGELFFQDNANVYAVNLDSGLPLPGWATTYSQRGGAYSVPRAAPLPRNIQSAVVVTDNEVIAIMGQPDRETMMRTGVGLEHDTRMVCLDRGTGAEKWAISLRNLPDQAENIRALDFGASPLVAGDQVFAIARGGKPNQFEDSYVLCFGLKDGKYRWSCYLASGNATPDAGDIGFGPSTDAVPHLAYASGRVYALTDLGALGAIDAYNGATIWLNLYPRPAPEPADRQAGMRRGQIVVAPKPWEQNSVIVDNGRVFILPSDGDNLLVYDAGNGAEIKRISLAELDNARTLLAVSGNTLLAASSKTVYYIDWQKFADPKAQANDDAVIWRKTLLHSSSGDSIRGRSFVTTSSVFVPTSWAIHRIDLKNGRAEDSYPENADRGWESNEGPGNIVVTQDHVVVAGADGVSVYTDIKIARAKLDAAVAAAPNDPNPRLDYAEVMFVAGEHDDAAKHLDEAITLLGGQTAMRAGAERDRVFNAALAFARKLTPARPKGSNSQPPADAELRLATDLFDRAASAALSAMQQVNYRIARARFEAAANHLDRELALYEEILTTPAWRAVQMAGASGDATSASRLSEDAIKDVISTPSGHEAFATYQQAAIDELSVAKTASDAEKMLEVARRYPNTDAAPSAMLAAADQYEADGKYRLATQVLNQAHLQYKDRADRTKLIEAQVRNYLRLRNGVAIAIGRLAAGARSNPQAKLSGAVTVPNGTVLKEGTSFADALNTLRQESAKRVAEKLPAIGVPVRDDKNPKSKPFLSEDAQLTLSDVDSLLIPPRELLRNDRIVTYSVGQGISVYTPGTNKPLMTSNALNEPALGCAWVGDDDRQEHLLVWGPTSVALFDDKSNNPRWQKTIAGLPDVEMVSSIDSVMDAANDPESGIPQRDNWRRNRINVNGAALQRIGQQPIQPPQAPGAVESIQHVCPVGDRVIFSTSTGRMLAFTYATGDLAWQTRLLAAPVHQLIAIDDFAVARLIDTEGVKLVVLDTFTGTPTYARVFQADGTQPVNMALAPDGTLVYTQPNRLCGKNLYTSGPDLDFQFPNAAENSPSYIGANQKDQLIIAEDRIISVTDQGMMVRLNSLENGAPLADQPVSTNVTNWNVSLRVVGPSLYISTRKRDAQKSDRVIDYNLNRNEADWPPSMPLAAIYDLTVSDKYLIAFDQIVDRNPVPANPAARPVRNNNLDLGSPEFALYFFGRYPGKAGETAESGRIDYIQTVKHPVGILQWQAVDGGLYYRSADRKLHFLQGAQANAQDKPI